jgi:molybdenum cofactor cytidylyltransferase
VQRDFCGNGQAHPHAADERDGLELVVNNNMSPDASIGLILLAAGDSTRLGRPKQLLEFRGATLLRRAAESAMASRARPVVVVLGSEGEACAAVLRDLPVEVVVNPAWKEGLASSIRAGVGALEAAAPMVGGVVVCVADQPRLSAAVLDALMEKQRASGAKMAAAEYGGKLGVPAVFCASLFGELKALRGDEGARSLLRRAGETVARVPFPGGEVDVDTPEDAARLEG